MLETLLNSIKMLKKYCKVNLNVFLNKKILDDKKNLFYMVDFLCLTKILLLNVL